MNVRNLRRPVALQLSRHAEKVVSNKGHAQQPIVYRIKPTCTKARFVTLNTLTISPASEESRCLRSEMENASTFFLPQWAGSELPKSSASSLIERMHTHLPIEATFDDRERNVQCARFALRPAKRAHDTPYAASPLRALRNHYLIWYCTTT